MLARERSYQVGKRNGEKFFHLFNIFNLKCGVQGSMLPHARHEIFYKKKKKKNSDKKKHTGIKKPLFLIEVILVLHTLVYHLLLILRAKYP